MREVLLVRHSQAFANVRNFAAFGNVESPLTEKGRGQCAGLNGRFRTDHHIIPEEYDEPVLASAFRRPQETAQLTGFANIDTDPLINESEVDREILSGIDVIKKHKAERWAPTEVRERAREFIGRVATGQYNYQIYFTHGMFIASVLLELEQMPGAHTVPFDERRGYVPFQATITPVRVPV